ncbi:GCN5 family acetyltransferase [Vibrio fortis]|uniref:GCN5 family acetyltransferase n=1 Tax=Vibrio fortis TaxID=212667 RepID=A0A066USN2_9VIBR|nr:GNAT family N-acetyltransferase [Vibrio fortis]KDN28922.1 GCN5 family acetyltransferase [Vibrio fortis]
MKLVCKTERLVIRQLTLKDADFVIRLYNDESFIHNIADKNIRTSEDAENYLTNGPLASYETYGFGLNLVSLRKTGTPIGICGVLKRPELDSPDLGYALLPEYCNQRYATEASIGVLQHAVKALSLDTVLAVTFPSNKGSNRVLTKVGFELKGTIELYGLENNLYEYRA